MIEFIYNYKNNIIVSYSYFILKYEIRYIVGNIKLF